MTTEKMSSGEALAEILGTVQRIEAKIDRAEEVIGVVVEQVQEVAASGIGSLLSGKGLAQVIEINGDTEHPQDPA